MLVVPPYLPPVAATAPAVTLAACVSAPQLLDLFVMDERGSPVLLCDESVYSRNRNFRLYLSSKLGKGVPLRVAQESKFKVCPH